VADALTIAEQAALLEVLEPSGAPQWERVSDIDGWALRAAAKAIAHDLREPILGIRRLAAWLSDLASPEERDDADRYRDLLEERLTRLEGRYDALRRFIESGLKLDERDAPIPIAALCHDAASSAAKKHGCTLELEIECDEEEPVLGGRVALQRCVVELCDNAVLHAGNHAGNASVSMTIRIASRPGALTIDVEDDGPGVEEADRERLFEPFAASGPAAGAGMGLAIARRMAALRGGWCELGESAAGGAKATLTWPA